MVTTCYYLSRNYLIYCDPPPLLYPRSPRHFPALHRLSHPFYARNCTRPGTVPHLTARCFTRQIADFITNRQMHDSDIFYNFEPELAQIESDPPKKPSQKIEQVSATPGEHLTPSRRPRVKLFSRCNRLTSYRIIGLLDICSHLLLIRDGVTLYPSHFFSCCFQML